MGLFYHMIPKNLTILYAWVSRIHVCEIDQIPGLTGIGICFERREKVLNFSYSDSLMTIYKLIGFDMCIFWHMQSIFHASSSN